MSEEVIFTLFYLILSFCIIYPPVEFVSAGFTIPSLFSRVLGSEDENFVSYHIKRTIVTLGVYSLLPLGYIIALFASEYFQDVSSLIIDGSLFWKVFFTTSLALPILALYQIRNWIIDDFKHHPIAINLAKFCNNNNRDWKTVAADINTEFRRVDKICVQTSSLVKVIATENWILKVKPFTILLAHQSDASLVVQKADTHRISLQTTTETQYLNIEVKSGRLGVETFIIRINASDFKDLEDRIARDITILPNVKFHKTVTEQFVDVFKETIKSNARYDTREELDQCIGCMQTRPNVKLQKLCGDNTGGAESCTTCYCKPMWCVDCMAKWFASRQESDQQNTWLSSKCTCPMCRAKFCILDVSLLDSIDVEE
ncbi:E3 ubiquitin-protein ligase TM129 [Tribolium madens]|uniref:E3 ubiquitin-protein ligase TM129 n=1 Tax=Tribolium madens TaxID=41895 RepID=UPI001CF7317C|nr:E3 ubiquitin-protein ligase TM129 [Tribolium madens]